VVRYVQLAHNRRVAGQTRAEVLLNLGREDQLDVSGLRRLARSIIRLIDPTSDGAAPGAEALEVLESRPVGATWALDALWGRLDIAGALAGALFPRRFGAATERALFALVADRALVRKRAPDIAHWASGDVWIPGVRRIDDQAARRAAALVALADDQTAIQEAVAATCQERLELRLDRLFVTETPARRRLGETEWPEVAVAVAATVDGIPLRVWCRPAVCGVPSALAQMRADLRAASPGPAAWVLDRGAAPRLDLQDLERAGFHWVTGLGAHDAPPAAQQALTRPGRYRSAGRGLRVKETEERGPRRVIVLHDPAQAKRERERREELVAHLEAELAWLEGRRLGHATARAAELTARAERTLCDHPAGRRYLRRTRTGELAVDRPQIAADARLDGKHLLETSDPELPAADVAAGYRSLMDVQARLHKLSAASLPPLGAGSLEDRLCAHVLLCWLALLLVRVAERRTGHPFEHIERELQRLHLILLAGPEGPVEQTTPLTPGQRGILAALEIEPPPRVVPQP
jgi:hypothetical protein